jgi:hypothetical protein
MHKVRTYKEYHSVCPSSELGLSQTLSSQRVFPSPQKQGGGGTLACGWGVGGGVPIPTKGIHYGTLYMYVLCGPMSRTSLCLILICTCGQSLFELCGWTFGELATPGTSSEAATPHTMYSSNSIDPANVLCTLAHLLLGGLRLGNIQCSGVHLKGLSHEMDFHNVDEN